MTQPSMDVLDLPALGRRAHRRRDVFFQARAAPAEAARRVTGDTKEMP